MGIGGRPADVCGRLPGGCADLRFNSGPKSRFRRTLHASKCKPCECYFGCPCTGLEYRLDLEKRLPNIHRADMILATASGCNLGCERRQLSWGKSVQVSFGPISWLIVGEVFPLAVRGPASALATLTNFGSNFVVRLSNRRNPKP